MRPLSLSAFPQQDRPSSLPTSPVRPTAAGHGHAKDHARRELKRNLSSSDTTGVKTDKSSDDSSKQLKRSLDSLAHRPNLSSSADMAPPSHRRRARLRSPWTCSLLTFTVTALAAFFAALISHSFLTRQLDPKGAAMSYMRPAFAKFPDFDTEHTRFASKYSLYLYREGGVDEDTRVKGIPVLFIPGNAGSYKQVRPVAAEAATYFHEHLQSDPDAIQSGKRTLDFFSVDFNEDITAFHGQTLLDQAEYLNEAISYILSLYHNPHRSLRDPTLPDPTSVILLGHSMGGIVARTMLTMPNYQTNSINTIVTLAAPHAKAPVSFDADIVNTYSEINEYWRTSYSAKSASQNPLSQVTLISVAGGGLDTVVPSDYSTIASLVPPTHGFTVFTSSIPHVWTGTDHLSIAWCDQLRKVLVRALYDVVDAGRPNQTKPRPVRMSAFKKRLLTGMEDVTEKTLSRQEPATLLTLEDNSNAIISQGERLVLRGLGEDGKPVARLLPLPPQGSPERKKFTLLTDQDLSIAGGNAPLEVMFCSVFPLHSGQANQVFTMNMDLSGDTSGSTRLACKSAASDVIELPASTKNSQHPFDPVKPFSYLEYDLEYIADHQFVAVVDKTTAPTAGWVVAEFSARADAHVKANESLRSLVLSGVDVAFPPTRPMMTEINIGSLSSSLLTYKINIANQACGETEELFAPLLRQYISEPYESKFFVNARTADISLHGVAPYIPPALRAPSASQGLSLQIWADPTCNRPMEVSVRVDLLGSIGKLWMRYRTVFAAFPLLVIALVLRKQFQLYDSSGVFMSFSESMDQSLRRSIPAFLLAMTFLAISFAKASQGILGLRSGPSSETAIDFTANDLLLGSQDVFFWFLIPLFGIMSVGICIAVNYAVLLITHFLATLYTASASVLQRGRDSSRIIGTFSETSLRKRIITTTILLLLVSTVIPYQFVFIVLCIVQIATCVRALSLARETRAGENMNFYNYVHSIFLLMLWVLPINIPVLVVWVHNLAVHWLTPFSSHHNILAVMPFVLLIETLSTGKMVPRMTSSIRHLGSVMFFSLAVYAAVYGVTYAYLLHFIVNIVCAWLTALHFSGATGYSLSSLSQLTTAFSGGGGQQRDVKKRP